MSLKNVLIPLTIVAILFAGAWTLSSAAEEQMAESPAWSTALQKSPVNAHLKRLGVRDFTLYCDVNQHRVGAIFQFPDGDGRGSVAKVGLTTCTKSGVIARWDGRSVWAQEEEYGPGMFVGQVTALLMGAKIPMKLDYLSR
jgi:hypothetical protein